MDKMAKELMKIARDLDGGMFSNDDEAVYLNIDRIDKALSRISRIADGRLERLGKQERSEDKGMISKLKTLKADMGKISSMLKKAKSKY